MLQQVAAGVTNIKGKCIKYTTIHKNKLTHKCIAYSTLPVLL